MTRPIQKVLFIEPRSPQEHIFSRLAIPRLGSLLLGTILQQQGLEVKVVIEEISAPNYRSLDFQPDLVCISSISSTAPRAYELADFYRQQGLPVVLGGAHPSFLPQEGLEHADYVVCGEGDEALPDLVKALDTGGSLADIHNLCYRDGDAIQQNSWRPFLGDLDSLPIPDYTLIHGWKARNRRGVISVATSRGCPFNCSFCSVIQLFGRKHRVTSIDRVIAEIRQNGLQARHIFFCDDNFTADRKRTKELCERIIAEGLKIEWSAQVRVEAAKDLELLELMAKSGCFVVFVGLESINPATLKAYNKSQTVEGIKDCVNNFHRVGIKVHGMFVFGSEEDHYQVIRDTVKVSRQLDLDSLQYLILTPIPGTPFYQEMEAQNRIICRDWSQYDGHHTVFQPRQFTPFELQMETNRAMKKFYSWPSVIKRLIARDLFFAKMKAFGRILLWKATWKRNNYFQQLQDQLYTRVQHLRQWLPQKGRMPRVGIPGDVWNLCTWEKGPRDFLIKFLERLGVEVVQETSQGKAGGGSRQTMQVVQAEIARLQEQADFILLPLWQGLGEAAQKIKDLHQEFTKDTMARLLALEFSRESFYNACMELGLCCNKRLGRIRRIYFQTLAEVGTPV
ncbi:MAG: B12-binding domain-containing radical SAM protein [Deltaproteobacteria bacterium]|nr:B12-binding domain-containing radical SAM protein [Deltaproteobacteria bacterium]